MDKPTIGLVLSGGGARGIAHIGALQALEDLGIEPDIISGASAGSMAAVYYAAGYRPSEMLKVVKTTAYLRLLNLGILSPGFIRHKAICSYHRRYLPEDSFSILHREVFVAAANMQKGRTEYFHEGQLILPMVASTAIPLLFSPVTINGVDYLDGGLLNNFPIEPLEGRCDIIIGVDVNPPVASKTRLNSKMRIMERTFYLSLCAQSFYRTRRADFLIAPKKVSNYGLFEVQKADELYKIGYEATMEVLKNKWDREEIWV